MLECVYLTFTEGYAATAGDELIRHELCDEAIRLARLLVDAAARRARRRGAAGTAAPPGQPAAPPASTTTGDVVLLADQDRAALGPRPASTRAWRGSTGPRDHRTHVRRRRPPTCSRPPSPPSTPGPPSWEATDWPAIVGHYDQLAALTRSPVVALNRAVAVSFADGPAVALPLLDALADDPRLARSHRLDRPAPTHPPAGRRRPRPAVPTGLLGVQPPHRPRAGLIERQLAAQPDQ